LARAYDGKFLAALDLKARNVDIHTEILYKAAILRGQIVEIPAHLDWGSLRTAQGVKRASSMRLRSGVVWNLLSAFMFRPFRFFIIPGFVVLLLSLYPLAWTLVYTVRNYRELVGSVSDPLTRFSFSIAGAFRESPHAFVVGGFALLVSIQLVFLGILALQSHRYFRDLYHLITRLRRDLLSKG
jgi:hypothetical protein